jgi:serine/threonine-protein kinase
MSSNAPGSSSPSASEAGRRVLKDRYTLHEEIGRGGMATVYRATDTTLGRQVAVKVVHPHLSREPEFVAQFLEMERRVARLYHPHLVTIFDAGTADDGACFVVMEHVASGSLRDRLQAEGAWPVLEAVRVVAQTAEALQVLHDAHVIHGDMKPDNVLLDEAGNAKLVDFGIAHVATTTGVLDPTRLAGTTPYLAPEQVQGQRADHRADLYALGLVAYELLAGRRAFEGDNWIAVAAQRLERDPEPLAAYRDDVPMQVERAICRVTAREPDDRFASAEAFRAALLGLNAAAVGAAKTAVEPVADRSPRLEAERGAPRIIHGQPVPRPTDGSATRGTPDVATRTDWEREPAVARNAWTYQPTTTHPIALSWPAVRDRVRQHVGDIRAGRRGTTVVAALIGLVVVALLLAVPRLANPPRPVRVPQLEGRTLDAAREAARQAGLSLAASESPSESVARGTVIQQASPASTTVQSDQPVKVVISSGPPPVQVPDLGSRRIDDARKDLAAIGLARGSVTEREVDNQPYGTVVEQSVRAGADLSRGGTVDVVVGLARAVSAPKLADKSLGDAEAALSGVGLRLGTVKQAVLSDKRAGTVVAQDPSPDTRLRRGESVAVTIAIPPSEQP